MESVRIGRLQARYRLPAAEGRARLDRVLRRALDEALEPALAAAGISPREEVCVRALSVPARLRLAEGDPALAAGWATAIARAVRNAVDCGAAVRYGSTSHALVDLLESVAAGSAERAWAWRQLGLWSAGPGAEVRALASRPEQVVAVLAAAPGTLERLAPRWSAAEWGRLARAAAEAAGADPRASAAAVARGGSTTTAEVSDLGPVGATPSDGTADRGPRAVSAEGDDPAARAVLRRSRIAVAVLRSGAATDSAVRRAVAVLALLETEPALGASPTFSARADAVAVALGEALGVHAVDPPPAAPSTSSDATSASTTDVDVQPTAARYDEGRGDDRGSVPPALVDARADRRKTDDTSSPAARRTDSPRAAAVAHADATDAGTADATPDTEDAADPPRDVRASGETRWGGLLFLLHLAHPLAGTLPDALAARPFRWTLHALARALAPMDEQDPAALAFAGLPPESDPPSRGEPPATDAERDAVRALADGLAADLRARLGADAGAAALLHATCRRSAVIEADPGWFDVRLRLDEASLDVRRAELDLDPGWIPWLGVAVRFVYG